MRKSMRAMIDCATGSNDRVAPGIDGHKHIRKSELEPGTDMINEEIKKEERKVFIIQKPSACAKCGDELSKSRWIELAGDDALCMKCSELGDLDFLPTGNAALTRRSKKHSALWAVVLKWSRARKRYERQGLLVETEALEKAHMECLLDDEARRIKRKKSRARRAKKDEEYVQSFANAIRGMYPHCLENIEHKIAEHACRIYSGRVGRTAMAKDLSPPAVRLAVGAHVRHNFTEYEKLLGNGYERLEALNEVRPSIEEILLKWAGENS